MSTVEATRKLTPDDLLVLPDAKNYELVDGELVERNMGAESSWIGGRVVNLMNNHSAANQLGWV